MPGETWIVSDINIDNALSLLNSTNIKVWKKVNEQSKRDTYILHTEAVGNKTFDISIEAGGWWFWGWRWCYFKHELWKTDEKFYKWNPLNKEMPNMIPHCPEVHTDQRQILHRNMAPALARMMKITCLCIIKKRFQKESNNGTNSGLFSSRCEK